MANSFGDQFLKAGLVNKDQLHKAKKAKHKEKKQKDKQKREVPNAAAEAARQQRAEKMARDAELNRQQKKAAEQKAIQAQIRQLIEMNALAREEGEVAYNFQDGNSIKTLFVPEELREKLARGSCAIARYDGGYEVIPMAVAHKIEQRDQHCIIRSSEPGKDEEDDYADYQVPDDLMW